MEEGVEVGWKVEGREMYYRDAEYETCSLMVEMCDLVSCMNEWRDRCCKTDQALCENGRGCAEKDVFSSSRYAG